MNTQRGKQTALTIRTLHGSDFVTLHEYWYDLEVMRAQLYQLPPPLYDRDLWVADQRRSHYDTALVCVAVGVVGALTAIQHPPAVQVTGLWIDLHTPQQKAIGAALWQQAVREWRQQQIRAIVTVATHRLPVERAFWLAQGAVQEQQEFKIIL